MTKKITFVPVEHKVLALIDNFQCDVPVIELSKNLSIRRIDTLPEDEKAAFDGEEEQYFHVLLDIESGERQRQEFHCASYKAASGEVIYRTIERANYVLRWHIKERFREPLRQHYDFLWKPGSEFAKALSALRVLKAGMIGVFPAEDFLTDLPITPQLPRATVHPENGYRLTVPGEVRPYTLLVEEIETLKQLFAAIIDIKQPGFLTALSRLDNQYSRAYIADRLIDAVIALEALYAGDVMNEIALRVGLRVSAHLGGSNSDEREHIFDLFNLAYNLRSRLVHGTIHSTKEIEKFVEKKGYETTEDFMEALDDMLRHALRYILLNVKGKKVKEMLHEPLDKAIRRGEAFIPEESV